MDAVEVDGSYGEGGGQILRTAAAFSVILRRPMKVTKVRAGREVPGLKQQHASTMKALAEIFGARVAGAEVGSSEVAFAPGGAVKSSVRVDMKTAASATLLLQAVVPAVALSGSGATLELVGGTDVPWSPTFDYLSTVAKAGYAMAGIRFEAEAPRRGYYPRGGGVVRAAVEASAGVRALDLAGPAGTTRARVVSRCAGLPAHVARRQLDAAAARLAGAGVPVESKEAAVGEADSPGSSVLVWSVGEGFALGGDCIGERGVRAEDVGARAADAFCSAARSRAAFDSHLADMVVPLLSLADRRSTVRVAEVTEHLRTGLHVASVFTGCESSWEEAGEGWTVSVTPREGHNA